MYTQRNITKWISASVMIVALVGCGGGVTETAAPVVETDVVPPVVQEQLPPQVVTQKDDNTNRSDLPPTSKPDPVVPLIIPPVTALPPVNTIPPVVEQPEPVIPPQPDPLPIPTPTPDIVPTPVPIPDIKPTPVPTPEPTPTPKTASFEQSSSADGLVVLEAEEFDRNITRNGLSWQNANVPGFSGTGAMVASPNSYAKIEVSYAMSSPVLEYDVKFVRTGKHYLWIRAQAASGSNDTLHIGVNGVEIASSDRISVAAGANFVWSRDTMDGVVATFDIPVEGVYTINVWMREAGLVLDELVVSANSNYLPYPPSSSTLDITPSMVNPRAGATEVVSNEVLSASFAGLTGYTNITLTSFNVKQNGINIDGTTSFGNKIAGFVPSALLEYNSAYSAEVLLSMQNVATGSVVTGRYAWTFTTINPNADWIVLFKDFNQEPVATYTQADLLSRWNSSSSAGVAEGRVSVIAKQADNRSNVMRIRYEGNKYGLSAGGVQWKTRLPKSDELYVSYWVKFGDGFDFVRGGKVPGLAGGTANTGGNVPTGLDGWSGRITWGDKGKMDQYMYYPDQPHLNGTAFWWELGGQRYFIPGQWHKVETRIKMNTPGQRNGLVQSWFDGNLALDLTGMRFRDVDSFAIDWFMFSTFFGGGDATWATTKQEYAYFDNIIISRRPITH